MIPSTRPGKVLYVPANRYDWGDAARRSAEFESTTKRRLEQMAARGYAEASEDEVAISQPLQHITPAEYTRLLRTLSFAPAQVSAELLDASAGLPFNGMYSDLHRIYRVAPFGLCSIYEQDLATSGSIWHIVAEMVNSRVGDCPAEFMHLASSSGMSRLCLAWHSSKMARAIQLSASTEAQDAATKWIFAVAEHCSTAL